MHVVQVTTVVVRSTEMIHKENNECEKKKSCNDHERSPSKWWSRCRRIKLSGPSRKYFLRSPSLVFIIIPVNTFSNWWLSQQWPRLHVQWNRVRTFSVENFLRNITMVLLDRVWIGSISTNDWCGILKATRSAIHFECLEAFLVRELKIYLIKIIN